MDCPKCFEYKDKIKKLEEEIGRLRTINIDGWKGKDKLIINKIGTEWHIVEHRKDKLTGEVGVCKTIVSELNVANLWEIIKYTVKVKEKTRYRKIVPSIILKYNLPIELEEFNGGKNRAKYYFPMYYYPIKILEKLGFVRYGGRGIILRLK